MQPTAVCDTQDVCLKRLGCVSDGMGGDGGGQVAVGRQVAVGVAGWLEEGQISSGGGRGIKDEEGFGLLGFYAQSSGGSWVSLAHGARLVTPAAQHAAMLIMRDMSAHKTSEVFDHYRFVVPFLEVGLIQ